MRRNIDLLQRVLDHITAHPKEHDQAFYGKQDGKTVVMCVAGRVTVLAGGIPQWQSNHYGGEVFFTATFNGNKVPVFSWARENLGLSSEEACVLFFATKQRVPDLLRALVAGETIA